MLELMIVRLMLTVTVNYDQEKVLLPLLSIDIGSWQFSEAMTRRECASALRYLRLHSLRYPA
jgi:hypothetical protein